MPLAALPLSAPLSGKPAAPQTDFRTGPSSKTRLSLTFSLVRHLLWCGVKPTYRHAAFLYRTLGELSFMRCSITCVLSPDWVALKCKYLWNKAVIGDRLCSLRKEERPQKPSAWTPPPEKPFFFFKDRLFISLFISLTVSSLRWGVGFLWVPFPSQLTFFKNLLQSFLSRPNHCRNLLNKRHGLFGAHTFVFCFFNISFVPLSLFVFSCHFSDTLLNWAFVKCSSSKLVRFASTVL